MLSRFRQQVSQFIHSSGYPVLHSEHRPGRIDHRLILGIFLSQRSGPLPESWTPTSIQLAKHHTFSSGQPFPTRASLSDLSSFGRTNFVFPLSFAKLQPWLPLSLPKVNQRCFTVSIIAKSLVPQFWL